MEFCILTRPRSGSHMLASALDSHPQIQCKGEYGMEKYSRLMGREVHDISGHIVQDFMLPEIDLKQFDKIILLLRDLSLRKEYRGLHWLEPAQVKRSIRDHGDTPKTDHTALYVATTGMDRLIINYDDMTGGHDIRELPYKEGSAICAFLGTDYFPMKPIFYKPTVIDAVREVQKRNTD